MTSRRENRIIHAVKAGMIVFIAGICVYFQTPLYINDFMWKAGEPCGVDYLDFKSGRHDISDGWPFIYKDGKKTGMLLFCRGDRMWIYYNDSGVVSFHAK